MKGDINCPRDILSLVIPLAESAPFDSAISATLNQNKNESVLLTYGTLVLYFD